MRYHGTPPRAQATLDRLQKAAEDALRPPKFCKDCNWHDFEQISKKDHFVYVHYCKFPGMRNLITGEPSKPEANRNNANLCGMNAKHWTAKVKAPK